MDDRRRTVRCCSRRRQDVVEIVEHRNERLGVGVLLAVARCKHRGAKCFGSNLDLHLIELGDQCDAVVDADVEALRVEHDDEQRTLAMIAAGPRGTLRLHRAFELVHVGRRAKCICRDDAHVSTGVAELLSGRRDLADITDDACIVDDRGIAGVRLRDRNCRKRHCENNCTEQTLEKSHDSETLLR